MSHIIVHWLCSKGQTRAQSVPLSLGNDADIRHIDEDGNIEVAWESGERYEKILFVEKFCYQNNGNCREIRYARDPRIKFELVSWG